MAEIHGTLTIFGAPRTKKNHQRILKTKTGRRFVAPSSQFDSYQRDALWQLKKLWRRPALGVAVAVEAHFYRDRDAGDLNNYQQALGDILERGRVVVNDRQIKSWDGSRLHVDRERPRVELVLREFIYVPR